MHDPSISQVWSDKLNFHSIHIKEFHRKACEKTYCETEQQFIVSYFIGEGYEIHVKLQLFHK